PLVRGANHLLAAYVRPAAAPARSAHGTSRGVPPSRLFAHLFEVLRNLSHFFRTLLPSRHPGAHGRRRPGGSVVRPVPPVRPVADSRLGRPPAPRDARCRFP